LVGAGEGASVLGSLRGFRGPRTLVLYEFFL
jgi:hypothetical protein